MQNFLRSSFLAFSLAISVILLLFVRKVQDSKTEEIDSQLYTDLVQQIPIESILEGIENNRQLSNRSTFTQDRFDLVLAKKRELIQERLLLMSSRESLVYLNTMVTNTKEELLNSSISDSEQYYHLKLLEVLYSFCKLEAQM